MKKYIAMALGLLLSSAAAAQEFPVTVQHSQGKVTLKQPPERVIALSMADYDTLVSLGLQPVNFVRSITESGVYPWNKPLPASTPILNRRNLSLEIVAALRPDLIDASNMRNADSIYRQLSNIAPTLVEVKGDSNAKWASDSWQERTLYTGRLIGREAKAKKVVNNTEKAIQQFAKRHPELKGKTFTFSYFHAPDQGTIGTVSNKAHPTVKYLNTLGLKLSPGVIDPSANQINLSAESWNKLDADIIFMGYGSKEAQKDLESNPFFNRLSAVKKRQLYCTK